MLTRLCRKSFFIRGLYKLLPLQKSQLHRQNVPRPFRQNDRVSRGCLQSANGQHANHGARQLLHQSRRDIRSVSRQATLNIHAIRHARARTGRASGAHFRATETGGRHGRGTRTRLSDKQRLITKSCAPASQVSAGTADTTKVRMMLG